MTECFFWRLFFHWFLDQSGDVFKAIPRPKTSRGLRVINPKNEISSLEKEKEEEEESDFSTKSESDKENEQNHSFSDNSDSNSIDILTFDDNDADGDDEIEDEEVNEQQEQQEEQKEEKGENVLLDSQRDVSTDNSTVSEEALTVSPVLKVSEKESVLLCFVVEFFYMCACVCVHACL